MSFDFKKAINGEPVYFKDVQIEPFYHPHDKLWRYGGHSWHMDGVPLTGLKLGRLSTDPPKKKVIVTGHVYKCCDGTIRVDVEKQIKQGRKYLGEISGEVEI